MLRVEKISNYINPYNLYHNFYTQKQSDKKEEKLSEAEWVRIIDESFKYITIIDNVMYLRRENKIYKMDVSGCSKTRIASIISYLS